ncbi:uncharacterized protein LOC144596801 [Rhinoraja longicauda]
MKLLWGCDDGDFSGASTVPASKVNAALQALLHGRLKLGLLALGSIQRLRRAEDKSTLSSHKPLTAPTASMKTMHFMPPLTLAFLCVVAVIEALPVERGEQRDELVTRCIIEALSNALSKPNFPSVTSECRDLLKSEKHEIAENKFERGPNHYEEDRHLEDSENPHHENKGSLRVIEEYKKTRFEEDKRNEDESEEKRYRQNHEEQKSETKNSEEDSRSSEESYPVKNTHAVRGHGDHHSSQENKDREAENRSQEGNDERSTSHEEKDSQNTYNTENTINVSHHKQQGIRSEEESSEEDKPSGIHGHSEERHGDIDRGAVESNDDLNDQYKKSGHFEHKKSDSKELEERDSEEGDKLHNAPMHNQKTKNHGHSEGDKSVHQDKHYSDISDESGEDLERLTNIHNYLKRNKNQAETEDKTSKHSRSSSEESKEKRQHLNQRNDQEEKMYSEEEEKRHHSGYKRHHSEDKEEKDEVEKRYHSEEKAHDEEKNNSSNEEKQEREESIEERHTSNGNDNEEERKTEPYPKVHRFWWKKGHGLEDRSLGSEGATKHSEHSHFYQQHEEHDDKRQETDDEKRQEEEDQGQNVETDEKHPTEQNLSRNFQEERLYDRMNKVARYLKSKSMEIPKVYDFEEEQGKQNHNEEKEKVKHTLTVEEEKDLENLAAMDLELEKMAEMLHDHQRD